MPRTNPKYRSQQKGIYRSIDEKVIAKISKLYDGECLGYYKTTWAVYVSIVNIGERYEFCWMDESFITPTGYNSWGAQKVDYFQKAGKGWDLYFEHAWSWVSSEAIDEYFDWVFAQEDVIYAEESKPIAEPIKLQPKKTAAKAKVKPPADVEGQIDLFEFVV